MPRKSNKSGGAFAYVQQFPYTISPCYNPTGKQPIPKLGWHAGGAPPQNPELKCDYEPSVAKMGIIDKPLTDKLSPSEIAWDNRYSCPKGTLKMQGGSSKILEKLSSQLQSKKSQAFSIQALKGGKEKTINVVSSEDKYHVSITDKESNSSSYFESKSAEQVAGKLKQYQFLKMNKSKKL